MRNTLPSTSTLRVLSWPLDFTLDSPATIEDNNRHYHITLTTSYTSTRKKSIKLFYMTHLCRYNVHN